MGFGGERLGKCRIGSVIVAVTKAIMYHSTAAVNPNVSHGETLTCHLAAGLVPHRACAAANCRLLQIP